MRLSHRAPLMDPTGDLRANMLARLEYDIGPGDGRKDVTYVEEVRYSGPRCLECGLGRWQGRRNPCQSEHGRHRWEEVVREGVGRRVERTDLNLAILGFPPSRWSELQEMSDAEFDEVLSSDADREGSMSGIM